MAPDPVSPVVGPESVTPPNGTPVPAAVPENPNPHDLGHKTTEFYVSLAMALVGGLLVLMPPRPGLDQIGAWLLLASGTGYTVSRGVAKAGAKVLLAALLLGGLAGCLPDDSVQGFPPRDWAAHRTLDASDCARQDAMIGGRRVYQHGADVVVVGCECPRCRSSLLHPARASADCQLVRVSGVGSFRAVAVRTHDGWIKGGDEVRSETVADVKTCGCALDASCGDCCGPKHCKCAPTK